jgi:hypothetical protein
MEARGIFKVHTQTYLNILAIICDRYRVTISKARKSILDVRFQLPRLRNQKELDAWGGMDIGLSEV